MQNKTLQIIIAIAFACGGTSYGATTAYSTAVTSNNPFAYYRFGESSGTSATDASGNGRTGTYTNGPVLGQTGAYGGDTAASFDGVNDYLSLGNFTAFGSSLKKSSAEFVFKTNISTSAVLFGETNSAAAGTAISIDLNMTNSNATKAGVTRIFLRSETSGATSVQFTNASLYDGLYHQLVYTYDPTAGFSVYVDGLAQSLTLLNSGGGLGTDPTFATFDRAASIADKNNRGTQGSWANVTVDEASFYTTTLTASDVNAHYLALVPEPSTWALLILGMFGLGVISRRKRSSIPTA
jgi:hypothetical protein